MKKKTRGPGKAYRTGMSLVEAVQKFSNEAKAEAWFVERRWPQGVTCPYCNGTHAAPRKNTRKTPSYRCNPCKRDFTVKTGTIMHDSKLPLSTWALAYYLFSTHLKGVSSMKLHRDLGVTQKTAWHLAHRIRETWDDHHVLNSPIEVDETYVGGLEKNKHANKKQKEGRGPVGKQAIVGMKSRATNVVKASVVEPVSATTLQRFVMASTQQGSTVYSDQNPGYIGLKRKGYQHQSVNHTVKEFVHYQAHTNGVESFWALMKRGYHGTYHQMSAKHLPRYVKEFTGRHNARSLDTINQMASMATPSNGKRLRYRDLIA